MPPQVDLELVPVHNAATKPFQERSTGKKAPARASDTIYEGVRYVTQSGLVYEEPTYTTTTIKNYSKSAYGGGLTNKLIFLLFTGDLDIKVKDESGNEDEDLSLMLKAMADRVGMWQEIRNSFIDCCWYGVYIANPVWKWVDNTYTLVDLVRLAPESFDTAPPGATKDYTELLKGITLNSAGEKEFYQTIEGVSKKVNNVFAVMNPLSSELASEPIFYSLFQVFAYLKFSWEATVQTINRIGAPIMFIKVIGGTDDDIAYANTILENYGKNTAFQLRENMEIIVPGFPEPRTPLEAIDALGRLLIDHFSPANFVQNPNATLSSTDKGSTSMMTSFVRGIHTWLEDTFEYLLQTALDANGYDGYTVVITLPEPEQDRTETNLQIVTVGDQTRAMSLNEKRELLGLPPADEETLDAIQTEYSSREAPATNNPFVTNAMRFYNNAVASKKKLTR